jgi:dTDP-4-amino-4,6-dideoxygalactose transaminase
MDKLFVGRPNIGDKATFLARVEELFDRRVLSNGGPFVKEFEAKVANLTRTKHCIAICNATVAIEIVSRALDLTGEVILPSYTFIACAHALQWQNITPVFCDIEPDTHLLDPNQIEALITPKTTAIMGVHLWGRACNIEKLTEIANRRKLRLFFDASHAFGCSYRGTPIGSFGEAEVFSFHATKFINCFEGGAITTNNDELAHRIRMMQNFGFTGFDQVEYLGVNGKMSEISAAMGLTNLESIDRIVADNLRNYLTYKKQLEDIPGIKLLNYNPRETMNYQYVVVELDNSLCPEKRDSLVSFLHSKDIIARKYFWPGCHNMEPYKSLYPNCHHWLSNTEIVANRVIVLPTGETVTPNTIDHVCKLIISFMSSL